VESDDYEVRSIDYIITRVFRDVGVFVGFAWMDLTHSPSALVIDGRRVHGGGLLYF
jgi:hypothetical protein